MALSRRGFLAATGFVAAGTALSGGAVPAFALAPMAGAPIPGAIRRKVGSVEVTALLDGYIDMPPDFLVGADGATVAALASAAHQSPGPRRTPVNAYLVNLGDRLVLVDAGTSTSMGPTLGQLPAALAAAGVGPAQVDTVLITHMHPDHIAGALTPTGQALFPNAELVVTEADYVFWHDDSVMNQAPSEFRSFFLGARNAAAAYAGRLRRIAGEGQAVGSIRSVPLPGHTPGHAGFVVESGGEALLIWADTVHLATYQFARPDWSMSFDVDPQQAAQTRRRIFDRAAADRVMVAGMHMPFPGFGHVVREGSEYRFVPAEWPYAL
ncbi:MBL fold metallo-hydrolase [Arenibaculum pallidiluteum]|uniref:MBL fold metallo-hydrolase n=1 Tax=Arenibaculum pallidiluteum TaxID=2812559 RepID=UPI001A9616B0|nr:MBL fold metallo-hydrolase [Arenibaculum pallidiluteum]